MEVVIYCNAAFDNSNQILKFMRDEGVEPHVIDCEKDPPNRLMLRMLAARMGVKPSGLLRREEPLFHQLHLDNSHFSDEDFLDVMEDHPSLIETPIIVTPTAVKLCRHPGEAVELLPDDADGNPKTHEQEHDAEK